MLYGIILGGLCHCYANQSKILKLIFFHNSRISHLHKLQRQRLKMIIKNREIVLILMQNSRKFCLWPKRSNTWLRLKTINWRIFKTSTAELDGQIFARLKKRRQSILDLPEILM